MKNGAQAVANMLVHAGHGFAAGDKLIVGTDKTEYYTVDSVDATHVNVTPSTPTVADEALDND